MTFADLLQCDWYLEKSVLHQEKQVNIQAHQKGVLEEYLKTLCLAHPKLGYGPIHQLLKDQYKLVINQNSVYRSMKQLGYLQPQVKGQNRGGAVPSDLVSEAVGTVIGLDFTHWKKEPIVNILEYQTYNNFEAPQNALGLKERSNQYLKSLSADFAHKTIKNQH